MRFLGLAFLSLLLFGCGKDLSGSSLKQLDNFKQCYAESKAALTAKYPYLISRESEFEFQLKFDCREAELISVISEPATSSISPLNTLETLSPITLDLPFIARALRILKPYCRSDSEINGDYCMATDIEAAAMVSNSPAMLMQLPSLIKKTSLWIQTHENPDLVDAIEKNYAGTRVEAVLLAGFFGLDDNGIQFDRLRANLLRMKRYSEYAFLFPSIAQYAPLGEFDGIMDLSRILFATRTGRATIPGTPDKTTKSYKIYAGVYFGCRLALEHEIPFLVEPESYAIGALYELIKLKDIFQSSRNGLDIEKLAKHARSGGVTGVLFSLGASFGFTKCQ